MSEDRSVPKQLTAPDLATLRRYMNREARVWGAAVRARRKLIGLTLEQLGAKVNVAPQTIHKIEKGEILPTDAVRLALGFALACEPSELFPIPTRAAIARDAA